MRPIDRWPSPPDEIERSLSCPALPRLWLPLLAPSVPQSFFLWSSPPAQVTLPLPTCRASQEASILDNTLARGFDEAVTEFERPGSRRAVQELWASGSPERPAKRSGADGLLIRWSSMRRCFRCASCPPCRAGSPAPNRRREPAHQAAIIMPSAMLFRGY